MSSPLYEKIIAKSDLIEIDGTDYSNAFREFRLSSEHSTEDVSGFSETGVDETLPGNTAQGFEGEFFINSEVASALWEMHISRDPVAVSWQPNGLVDTSGPRWYGNCTINVFNPGNTRGSASTSPFSATAADAAGIHMVNT
jgi:hypothetical protein